MPWWASVSVQGPCLPTWAAFQKDFLRHNSVGSQDLAKSYSLGIHDGRTVAL